jgi:hypothetical protein
VDRREQGLKRWVAVEAGNPAGRGAAPANQRDDGLLAATLDMLTVVGPLPSQPVVHLQRLTRSGDRQGMVPMQLVEPTASRCPPGARSSVCRTAAPVGRAAVRQRMAPLARFEAGVGEHPAQVDDHLSVDVLVVWPP